MIAAREGTRRTRELGGVDRFEDLSGWVRQSRKGVSGQRTSNSSASTSADMAEGAGSVDTGGCVDGCSQRGSLGTIHAADQKLKRPARESAGAGVGTRCVAELASSLDARLQCSPTSPVSHRRSCASVLAMLLPLFALPSNFVP